MHTSVYGTIYVHQHSNIDMKEFSSRINIWWIGGVLND